MKEDERLVKLFKELKDFWEEATPGGRFRAETSLVVLLLERDHNLKTVFEKNVPADVYEKVKKRVEKVSKLYDKLFLEDETE